MSLPKQIQAGVAEGEKELRAAANKYEMQVRKGRPRKLSTEEPRRIPTIVADSEEGLNALCAMFNEVVGLKERGNKRRGIAAAFYADLIQHFLLLKSKGITLPRNGSLSAKACKYGLFEILQRHGYTGSEAGLKNRIQRDKIANKYRSQFDRVADTVKKMDVDKSGKE